MQFTVLIEFLIPGLATTLLGLALLPAGVVPSLPDAVPQGETATALLLLAVSYPVGILTNFPVFRLLQQGLLTSRARRLVLDRYATRGVDLMKLGHEQFGLVLPKALSVSDKEDAWELFNLMRSAVFRENIDRLTASHLFYEGLQRLARGMLLPLLMAILLVSRSPVLGWHWLGVLGFFWLASLSLLAYSIKTEELQIARFFITLTQAPSSGDIQRWPAQNSLSAGGLGSEQENQINTTRPSPSLPSSFARDPE